MSFREEENHPYRVIAKKILSLSDYDHNEDTLVMVIDETMKQNRLALYQKYKNTIVRVDIGGLDVDCFVHDVKVVDGSPQYQVKPVAGDKAVWVTKFKKK
jgi:hypothetical protein